MSNPDYPTEPETLPPYPGMSMSAQDMTPWERRHHNELTDLESRTGAAREAGDLTEIREILTELARIIKQCEPAVDSHGLLQGVGYWAKEWAQELAYSCQLMEHTILTESGARHDRA